MGGPPKDTVQKALLYCGPPHQSGFNISLALLVLLFYGDRDLGRGVLHDKGVLRTASQIYSDPFPRGPLREENGFARAYPSKHPKPHNPQPFQIRLSC